MSRAFVRESDFPESDEPPRRAMALPPGAPNYITAAGAERLRRELADLKAKRAVVAGTVQPEERAARARLDSQIASLEHAVLTMQVVSGPPDNPAVVRVGATVVVRDPAGAETTFRLVGVDETDAGRNWIAWVSPAGRALLNARVGQSVAFQRPGGETTWEIVQIDYE